MILKIKQELRYDADPYSKLFLNVTIINMRFRSDTASLSRVKGMYLSKPLLRKIHDRCTRNNLE